jgi:hypothetical protein
MNSTEQLAVMRRVVSLNVCKHMIFSLLEAVITENDEKTDQEACQVAGREPPVYLEAR